MRNNLILIKKASIFFIFLLLILIFFRIVLLIDSVKHGRIGLNISIFVEATNYIETDNIRFFRISPSNNIWKLERKPFFNKWILKERLAKQIFFFLSNIKTEDINKIIIYIDTRRFEYSIHDFKTWKQNNKKKYLESEYTNNLSLENSTLFILPSEIFYKKSILTYSSIKSLINWPGEKRIFLNEIRFFFSFMILFVFSIIGIIIMFLCFIYFLKGQNSEYFKK